MIDSFEGEYRFLSNFYSAPIKYHGMIYPSSEHLYQALKTLDLTDRTWIKNAETAGQAKKRGKEVTLREDWDDIKDDVMRDILKLKFEQNPELAQKLIDTGDQELVEGNWWGDVEWGVCKGVGKNKLGLLLQELRTKLIHQNHAKSEET